MTSLKITGGRRLAGDLTISGAKNAALPMLCASLLTSAELVLSNMPSLRDVSTLVDLLRTMGVRLSLEEGRIALSAAEVYPCIDNSQQASSMRASILMLGPLVSRFGYAKLPLPGGCAIGARPVDQHIAGLQKMGADIRIEDHMIIARASRLKGAVIQNAVVTVTGTENLMMAAVLAEGETVIHNAAKEPEVVDLARCLNQMGARIQGAGTARIVIEGVSALSGTTYEVMPDRIETGTYLCAAAATGGHIVLHKTSARYLEAVIHKLRESGCQVMTRGDKIILRAPAFLRAVHLTTQSYPGFPTDMQAQFMALNALSHGIGVVRETIFENRFMHVHELCSFGADIRIHDHCAFVHGKKALMAATVRATDLRASASLVIAGLAAEGVTLIRDIYHLDRGYESLEHKLSGVGAELVRVPGHVLSSKVEVSERTELTSVIPVVIKSNTTRECAAGFSVMAS